MSVLVVDASVLAPVVADGGEEGRRFRQRLRGETVAGPDLLRIEVMSVVRRHAHAGLLTPDQTGTAIEDLVDFPVVVYATAPLLHRAWALRDNITSYDGCYVALAEAVDRPLLTADRRLAKAADAVCQVEVL
jgi:predicted nucleic acid-binding protein